MATVRNADERLIILLPPDLLEEVRRAAEEADLSVSQIVRQAIRSGEERASNWRRDSRHRLGF
jgi:metal-responsive CopG/Arc/MetJ family transcriptional regulator